MKLAIPHKLFNLKSELKIVSIQYNINNIKIKYFFSKCFLIVFKIKIFILSMFEFKVKTF